MGYPTIGGGGDVPSEEVGQKWKVTGTIKRVPEPHGVMVEHYNLLIVELPLPAVQAVLTIKEKPVPSSINISADDTGAKAALSFLDHLGDVTSAPLSSDGATAVNVAYTSDNPAVATVDAASGALTPVSAGTVNIGADVTDAITGAEALEPDGVTAFSPAPVNVTVDPGAAVTDQFVVTP